MHAQYLAMGGVDGFIGDGYLRQAAEGVVEVFYSVNLLKAIWLTADYQFLWNPGYNADRGPGATSSEGGSMRSSDGLRALVARRAPRGDLRRAARGGAAAGAGLRARAVLPVGAGRRLVRHGYARHARRPRRRGRADHRLRARIRCGVSQGSQQLAVVSDQAFTDFGFAVTYDRFRLYLNLDVPLAVDGDATAPARVGGYTVRRPVRRPRLDPDTLTDARVGFDVRLLGEPTSPFRLGAGAQLLVPTAPVRPAERPRGRLRHRRHLPRHAAARSSPATSGASPTRASSASTSVRSTTRRVPGSPQGSELLFGAAAGPRIPLGPGSRGTGAHRRARGVRRDGVPLVLRRDHHGRRGAR